MGVSRHDCPTGLGPLVISRQVLVIILDSEIEGNPQVDEPEIIEKALGEQSAKV